jgi:ferritin
MAKDERYKRAKHLIQTGYIKTFRAAVENVNKTIVARDLGTHHETFEKLLSHPEKVLEKIYALAELFEIEPVKLFELIDNQVQEDKRNKKKR